METEPTASQTAPGVTPLGFHSLRVDAAGRLKLPARFLEYIRALGRGETLFITRFEDVVKIYLPGAWERELAQVAEKDPDSLDDFEDLAEYLGAQVDLDPQGRATIPQKIREALPWENLPVQVRLKHDIISVYREDQLKARMESKMSRMSEILQNVKHRSRVRVD
jgi:DNA-binding transcriptional regulator/RsmH inhibitor MraZ